MALSKAKIASFVSTASSAKRYEKQIDRIKAAGNVTTCIEAAVDGVVDEITKGARSLVVYGDPQSGKTEMMICLTAKLLDEGYRTIVHLMNDSVDLLTQNLERSKSSGLSPAPRNFSDLASSPLLPGHEAIVYCKKNGRDLQKLVSALSSSGPVVVIDDEADFATPNSKINLAQVTPINALVDQLIGPNGKYIGVTATPARLDLNNTFNNQPETWVHFPAHPAYTGQDVFFPVNSPVRYRLNTIAGTGSPIEARGALARFLVTVAYLNTTTNPVEKNYTLLIHTSGQTADHTADRRMFEDLMDALRSKAGTTFEEVVSLVHDKAIELYPGANADDLTQYVVTNAARSAFVVLNSTRKRDDSGGKPTEPRCPFTVVIGGNIVSRGVTFPNLLAMYFTRDVKGKMQQDTYIQRARMFGSRGSDVEHFDLTIPRPLYDDWHRCFVFHRLALEAIKKTKASPVWLGDKRISIASSSSIDRGTVDLNKGEMSFAMFDCTPASLASLDSIVSGDPNSTATLQAIAASIGEAMPQFLIDYLDQSLAFEPGTLAIHTASSIAGYGASADIDTIARPKGFLGAPQLEQSRFPDATHHVKVLHNGKGKARVFYKNLGSVHFVQNQA